MEYDRDFAINLSLYEGADLEDYINFMVLLRSHVNTMKPSEVMVLGLTGVLVEKIQQLFPNLDLQDIPSLEPFANLRTFSTITWNRRPAKEREPLSKPCGL
ncbi:hypothetical protein TNCV_339951 [Trichonephila clavipes]|nr:hypothetical protein TNCV_339951 [Trichonephila clavipes]